MRNRRQQTNSRQVHRILTAMAVFAVLSTLISPAFSIYMRPDLEKIPVASLIESLQKKLADKPDDITHRLNLARAHAMSFAKKGEPVDILKGKADQGVWFGFEPTNIPFGQVKKSDDAEVRKAAEAQLKAAIEAYEKVLEKNNEHTTARLGYAWCLQQAEKTEKAVEEYRKVVEAAWKDERNMQVAGLGFHSIVTEASGYLIPLLDANKDAAEINELKARSAKTSAIPRPITPIAIPLRDELTVSQLIDREATVRFDADGTARPNAKWSWITPDAAWLVYDLKGDSKVTSALQLFGNVTFWMFWEHGYQPLSLLDQDADGELRGAELGHLSLWYDKNSNGISEPGEVQPLSTYQIVALSCQATPMAETNLNAKDCVAWSAAGVTFADGSRRPTYDIMLHEQLTSAQTSANFAHGQKETP
ncbi:MAG: tetratricopeptide repeat protein [Pirellulales bacterium]|nr:tetratricopeptide repeat protein [Pirellulales bacterium]